MCCNLHAYVLPCAEDTFDETAGAAVADILDPPRKQTTGAAPIDIESDATARYAPSTQPMLQRS